MATLHWVQLALTDGIGPVLLRRLLDAAGSAEAACDATPALLQNIKDIGLSRAQSIHRSLREAASLAEAELERAAAQNVQIICQEDPAYPPMLKTIPDPPPVLYVRGTLEARDLNGFAIVGSRRCSFYGREQAERFAAMLAGAGFTIVSGGARGTDSAAHRGALAHPQGRTIAVLGSGADVAYPPENAALFDQIARRGAVVSEFPMGSQPLRDHFPRRNRIISGMSRGVLVVEADERSGALITARQAGDDHGRPVFALPGKVDNPLSAGPHQLIRDGAILVTKLDDIIEGLSPLSKELAETEPTLFPPEGDETPLAEPAARDESPAGEETPYDGLTDRQRQVLEAVGSDVSTADQIIDRAELPAAIVMQELTFLTLKGRLRRVDGQTFARVGKSR